MDQDHCERKKMKYDVSDSSSSSSSSDESLPSDDIIGHDSSDYNERAKFGGEYMFQSCMRKKNVKLNQASSFSESKFDLESQDGRSSLTSTWLETQLRQENQKSQLSPGIQSQISKIDMMFSSFVKNSQHDLQVLNNLVQAQSRSVSMDNLEVAESNTILNFELQSNNESQANSLSTLDTLPIIFENIPNSECSKTDQNVKAFNDNETDNLMVVVNANVSNDEEVVKGDMNVPSISTVSSVIAAQNVNEKVNPNVTFDVEPHQDPKQQIDLSMKGIPEYEKVEALLDQEDVETENGANMPHAEGLVANLLPFANEAEPKYMNRSIKILFEPNFFVESVGWQTAEKRINIKNGYLLGCWKKSFETNFGHDEDNARFMSHFRRYKSAKRAANKAADKRKNVPTKGN